MVPLRRVAPDIREVEIPRQDCRHVLVGLRSDLFIWRRAEAKVTRKLDLMPKPPYHRND